MNQIAIKEAKDIILSTKGKLFGVEFIKQDQSVRKMVCRLGVQKGVKGVVDRKAEDEQHNLLTVFDFNADRTKDSQGGFRRINFGTLRKVKANGVEYEIGSGV